MLGIVVNNAQITFLPNNNNNFNYTYTYLNYYLKYLKCLN